MKNVWIYLIVGLGLGLLIWVGIFLGLGFDIYSQDRQFVLSYFVETIVRRPHVPLSFGLAGLILGAVCWAIKTLLTRPSSNNS